LGRAKRLRDAFRGVNLELMALPVSEAQAMAREAFRPRDCQHGRAIEPSGQ